jgi:hypothetical protein
MTFEVEVGYWKGEVSLTVDYKHKMAELFGLNITFGDKIIVGTSVTGKSNLGKPFLLTLSNITNPNIFSFQSLSLL